jgi:AraC-like DNA-binding protein
MAVYWYLQVRLLFSPEAAPIRKDRSMFNWLRIYTVLEMFLFLPFVTLMVVGLQHNPWIYTIGPAVAVALSTVTLILNPDILYGRSVFSSTSVGKPKPMLDGKTIQRISQRLEALMLEHKPYLDADYTIKELADAVGVPPYRLSAYMNQVVGQNFNEFVNQWRIRYCLEMMKSGETGQLNLHGIAEKCGFNSRQSFSAAFKKTTGQFPSAFLKKEADL